MPPADKVLVFFNYSFSPFYASLPKPTAPAGAAQSSVRWLRHRNARAPNEFQQAADEGRLSLLYELYAEASKAAAASRKWWQ